jgi:Uma2 family endonuclease
MAVAQYEARAPAFIDRVGAPAHRVVLDRVSWRTYESLMADFGERRIPRFAYDRGALEIVSPTPPHEEANLALAAVVAAVAEEWGVDFRPMGATTYRRRALQQGFEADSSFYISNRRFARELQEVDPTTDPPPDLVVEVDVSHSSIDKLSIYTGFGVPEIWRWQADRVSILVLGGGSYQETDESRVLPPLTADVLTRFLLRSRKIRRLDWVREVRAWAREHRASGE